MSGYISTTAATSFTSFGWPFDAASLSSLLPVYSKREEEPVRSLLQALIKNHHDVYHIEHRDQPNELARVLVALHDLGGRWDICIPDYLMTYTWHYSNTRTNHSGLLQSDPYSCATFAY